MCKFDSPSHPNYIFIRNSLVKATEDVLGDGNYVLSHLVRILVHR